MKLWIASDTTNGAMYDAERFFDKNWKPAGPIAIANKYGRAETGEIIHIWMDDNTDHEPDHKVYWDNRHQEYRAY